jgi:hypothetical protein
MAKRLAIPSKQIQLNIVGPSNKLAIPRDQSFSLSTSNPSTDVDEIGNSAHAGTSKDIPAVTLTFSVFDVGVKVFSVLTGTDWTAYPAGGVDISQLGEVDAILYVKDPTVSDYVKSGHARRLQVSQFSYSYSVDGEGKEDYTALGSKRTWFKYDVIVDRITTGTKTFTMSQTPIQLASGNKALSVILDGQYLSEVTGTPATGQYKITGTTLTTFDSLVNQIEIVYHANPTGNNWSDVSDTSMPASIRGMHSKILISANDTPRVQSITINGNLNTQAVNEMGNPDKIVGYQKQVPTVDGTITVLDTDTDLISQLTTGTIGSGVEWNLGEGCVTGGISLSVRMFDPCNDSTVVKELYLDSITTTTDAYSVNVNGNASLQIGFKSTTGHAVVYSGMKTP